MQLEISQQCIPKFPTTPKNILFIDIFKDMKAHKQDLWLTICQMQQPIISDYNVP